LAANFWNDPSAGYAIETMTKLFRKTGYPEQKARLAAVAQYETTLVAQGAKQDHRSTPRCCSWLRRRISRGSAAGVAEHRPLRKAGILS
jgi:hypothetical protein